MVIFDELNLPFIVRYIFFELEFKVPFKQFKYPVGPAVLIYKNIISPLKGLMLYFSIRWPEICIFLSSIHSINLFVYPCPILDCLISCILIIDIFQLYFLLQDYICPFITIAALCRLQNQLVNLLPKKSVRIFIVILSACVSVMNVIYLIILTLL